VLGEGPGLGPNPGLSSHGSQITDRTIETHTPTDLCSNFQLSGCYTGREIAHIRTDDITISVEPIFTCHIWNMREVFRDEKNENFVLLIFTF
jgi:hypothetical protein